MYSSQSLEKVFIVAAKRTAFGKFGGSLKALSANQLGGIVAKDVVKDFVENGIPIDSVVMGNVCQTSADAPYLARHVGHRVGLPNHVPALTINRLCGSGFQSIINAVHEIRVGDAETVLAGGAESMSQAPHILRNARWGVPYGVDMKLEDSLAASLTDTYPTPIPMAITAENLAMKYSITRADCDSFALESQKKWAAAQEAGKFKAEITPIEIKKKDKVIVFDRDEHPRPQSTMADLDKLPPVFKKDGLVTAGNASGISDGAGASIVASENAVKKFGLKPLASIKSYHVVGVDPAIMGIGPVPAIKEALRKASLELKDIGHIEVNEAFAAQYLAVERELQLDRSKVNASGGAIALGHPLAASGARITAHLCHVLQSSNHQFAIGAACIGGGQGIALILEKCVQ